MYTVPGGRPGNDRDAAAELAAEAGIPLLSTIATRDSPAPTADRGRQPWPGRVATEAAPQQDPHPPMDVTQGAKALIFAAADRAAEQGA